MQTNSENAIAELFSERVEPGIFGRAPIRIRRRDDLPLAVENFAAFSLTPMRFESPALGIDGYGCRYWADLKR